MAFPVIESVSSGTVTSNDTTWDMTYPSGVAAGDLLIVFIGTDGVPTISVPGAPWSNLLNAGPGASANAIRMSKALATGAHSGAVIFTLSGSEQGCWVMLRISGWEGTIGTQWDNSNFTGAVAIATAIDTTGGSNAPNPPSLDPLNWGTEDTLWIAAANADGTPTFTGKDTNYTYVTGSPATSGGAGGASLAVASRNNAASSEDPGAFALSANETWAVATIGVRPAAAATPLSPPFTRRGPRSQKDQALRDADPWSVSGWLAREERRLAALERERIAA